MHALGQLVEPDRAGHQNLSGYGKAEVERIWLPLTGWLLAGDRRTWLAVQAIVALMVNHLLLTTW